MTYRVHVTFLNPAWNEREGFDITVTARDKATAIRYARREAADAGHTGRLTFKAHEITD